MEKIIKIKFLKKEEYIEKKTENTLKITTDNIK